MLFESADAQVFCSSATQSTEVLEQHAGLCLGCRRSGCKFVHERRKVTLQNTCLLIVGAVRQIKRDTLEVFDALSSHAHVCRIHCSTQLLSVLERHISQPEG